MLFFDEIFGKLMKNGVPAPLRRLSPAALEPTLDAVVAFHAQDGETSILARLGQAEKHGLQHALGGGAEWQQHLCEREDIERYATRQHYRAGLERQRLEPSLDLCGYIFKPFLHIRHKINHFNAHPQARALICATWPAARGTGANPRPLSGKINFFRDFFYYVVNIY